MLRVLIGALLCLGVTLQLALYSYHPILVFVWLIAVLLFSMARPVLPSSPSLIRSKAKVRAALIVFALCCIPLFVRWLANEPTTTHADEFALGYFSDTFSIWSSNFFGPVPDPPMWITQFASMYFVLQGIALEFLPRSYWGLKFSTFPFIFLIALMIFILARSIADKRTAVVALLLYAFFSPSIYIETYSINVHASALFYIIFVVCNVRYLQKPSLERAAQSGLSAALCYLHYPSSFMALPVLLLSLPLVWRISEIAQAAKHFVIIVIVFASTLSPFVAGQHSKDHYLLQRVGQVVPFVRAWSYVGNEQERPKQDWESLPGRFREGLQYFVSDDIGGLGGYDYGHLRLLAPLPLLLVVIGIGAAVILKMRALFVMGLAIALPVGAFAFASPPPLLHRYSVVLPLFIIVMALPFYLILNSRRIPRALASTTAAVLIAAFAVSNFMQLEKAMARERGSKQGALDDLALIMYFSEHFSDRRVIIAAFPTLSLQWQFYFLAPHLEVYTDYHSNVIRNFDVSRKYACIILFPGDFNSQFAALDPNGRFIEGPWKSISVFAN